MYPGVTGFRGANSKCRFYVKLRITNVNKVNYIELQHNIHVYTQLIYEVGNTIMKHFPCLPTRFKMTSPVFEGIPKK